MARLWLPWGWPLIPARWDDEGGGNYDCSGTAGPSPFLSKAKAPEGCQDDAAMQPVAVDEIVRSRQAEATEGRLRLQETVRAAEVDLRSKLHPNLRQ